MRTKKMGQETYHHSKQRLWSPERLCRGKQLSIQAKWEIILTSKEGNPVPEHSAALKLNNTWRGLLLKFYGKGKDSFSWKLSKAHHQTQVPLIPSDRTWLCLSD